MSVPRSSLLLLSGIPAVGKGRFGSYLASEHGFAHYDLEHHPDGWPHPELQPVWNRSRRDFVAELKRLHKRVALDWGFPAHAVPWVNELLAEGVRLIWFDADVAKARALFIKRGGIDVAYFDTQISSIQRADLPSGLQCVRVGALTDAGALRAQAVILRKVFPS